MAADDQTKADVTFDWHCITEENSSALQELSVIWESMGLENSERYRQLQNLKIEINSMVSSKVALEKKILDEYRDLSNQLNIEIKELTRTLEYKKEENEIPEKCCNTLLQKLALQQKVHKELMELKDRRTEKAVKLVNEIQRVSNRVGNMEEYQDVNISQNLSKKKLESLSKTLSSLLTLQESRMKIVQSLASCLKDLIADLSFTNLEAIDKDAINFIDLPEDTNFPVNLLTIQSIEKRIKFFTLEKNNRTLVLRELGSKIQPLWDLLDISEIHRQNFFVDNTGLSDSVIQSCRDELQNLLQLKQSRLHDIVLKLKEKILHLHKKLGIPDEVDVEIASLLKDKSFSDLSLEAHQKHLASLLEQEQALEPISIKYGKYTSMCEIRETYEAIIKDSARLLDRRRGITKLREEERQRKIVEKNLPLLVKKILADGEEYEKQYKCCLSFLKDVRNREATHKEAKEREKARKRLERISTTPKSARKQQARTIGNRKAAKSIINKNDENRNLVNH